MLEIRPKKRRRQKLRSLRKRRKRMKRSLSNPMTLLKKMKW